MRTNDEKKPRMKTLEEIKACPKEVLAPADVAGVLRCDPFNITRAAKSNPEMLRFPVIVMGSRVKIPKAGFVRFMEGIQEGQT